MLSKATTVREYLASLPEDRREAIERVRKVILDNLPEGFEEGMQYGMIGYYIPHSIYPAGYHCDPKQPLPYASLASQKNYMSVYLMCIYGNPKREKWFRTEWAKTGKKLDMGKSCVRFRKVEDLALDVLGRAIAAVSVEEVIEFYEAFREAAAKKKKASRRPAAGTRKVVKKVVKKTAKTGKKTAPARGGRSGRR